MESISKKICGDLASAWGKAGEAGLDKFAPAAAESVHGADKNLLKGLDRSAVPKICEFNRDALRKFPERLKLKYQNMAMSPHRFFTGQPELMAYDMRGMLQQPGPVAA